ncbi:MAG: thiol-disulfide oxidoreductase [Chitinophagaceae bacterium]|nr:thiol-disulfide oxidoreductase [Chitinophagaceae bacterium]
MRCLIFFMLMLLIADAKAQTAENIFKETAAAMKALHSVNYEVYSEYPGNKVSASVIINRIAVNPMFGASQVKVSGMSINENGTEQIAFASDGKRFEYKDQLKDAIVRIDSGTVSKIARSPVGIYLQLALPAYFNIDPFSAGFLKDVTTMELLSDTMLFNSVCYKIAVTREYDNPIAGGKSRSTGYWFIGKEDHLVHGFQFSVQKQFLKIRKINESYTDEVFHLSAEQNVIKMTGTETISAGLLKRGETAPDWTLPAVNGPLSLSSLKGKIVLLDFWGTWCGPCIKSMPDIQAIHEQFKGKDVQVIGVSVETEPGAKPFDFVKKKGFTYTIVADGNKITERYKVKQFPSVYLIDKTGKIIHAEHTSNPESFKKDMVARIEAVLK